MADEAEARYKSSSEAIEDSEYRREGSGAIATITRPLPLQESAEPVTLTVTDTITYGQELRTMCLNKDICSDKIPHPLS